MALPASAHDGAGSLPMTPLNAAQSDLDAVEAIVRAAGTSFYRGMRVLPPDRRHAMYAIYAFCRIVDDIVDEDGAFADKLPRLAAWRDRVAGLYRGQADGPVTRVLVAAVQRFDLRQEDFLAVIDGMQMDAETVIVAPDLATLDLYCDRVAAAVGRLSVRAFGDSSAGRRPGGLFARPGAATHQHPARRAGGRRARPALSAARVAGRGGGAARSVARRCARPACRASALASPRWRMSISARRTRRCGELRREGDEAGAADGGDLRRHPVAPGAPRLVAAGRTRQPARLAEAVARAALRRGVATGQVRRRGGGQKRSPGAARSASSRSPYRREPAVAWARSGCSWSMLLRQHRQGPRLKVRCRLGRPTCPAGDRAAELTWQTPVPLDCRIMTTPRFLADPPSSQRQMADH